MATIPPFSFMRFLRRVRNPPRIMLRRYPLVACVLAFASFVRRNRPGMGLALEAEEAPVKLGSKQARLDGFEVVAAGEVPSTRKARGGGGSSAPRPRSGTDADDEDEPVPEGMGVGPAPLDVDPRLLDYDRCGRCVAWSVLRDGRLRAVGLCG